MESRFNELPSRLQACSTVQVIAGVPCFLVRKDDKPRPFLFWIHGRTVDKELDSGRYLRYVRRGINVCAVDLPGHGQRFDESMQARDRTLSVVLQMVEEIDCVLEGLAAVGGFELNSGAIGGMSAGGLVAILRMLRHHPFQAAVLESTGGSWSHLRHSPICKELDDAAFEAVNPMNRLDNWKDIPVVAFHSIHDSLMPFASESEFIDAIKLKSQHPEKIELVAFNQTGAPDEHMGFGRESSFVKEVQVEFIERHVLNQQRTTT